MQQLPTSIFTVNLLSTQSVNEPIFVFKGNYVKTMATLLMLMQSAENQNRKFHTLNPG